jgi:hypothetical protein
MMINVGIAAKVRIQHYLLLRLDKAAGHEGSVAMGASRPVAWPDPRASEGARGQPSREENLRAVCCFPDMPAK